MTYYYIYKITCTKGSFKDKFYFGKHTTTNLEDGYKGSGVKINSYYKKYPEDYIKEIICFCNNTEELNRKEYEIIHPWLNNEMCLNLMEGGQGGSISEESKRKISIANKGRLKGVKPWITGKGHSEETKKKLSEINKGRPSSFKGKHHSVESKKNMSEAHKGKSPWNKGKESQLKGIPRSEETKKKISEALKGRNNYWIPKHYTEEEKQIIYASRIGTHISEDHKQRISVANKGKSPCKNRIHINNGIISKMIKKEELEKYLNNGWIKGRIKK